MAKSNAAAKVATIAIIENEHATMAEAFGATVEPSAMGTMQKTLSRVTATASPADSQKASIAADITGNVLTLTFSHGGEIVCNADNLSEAIKAQAMMHGLKQKLVDAAAIARDTETGRTASIRDKFEAVKEVFERIRDAGQWNKIREGGAGGNNGLLVRALMELTGKTRAAIEEFLDAKSKEEKQALRKNAKVSVIIVRMQAENADDSIDTDAMLDELS